MKTKHTPTPWKQSGINIFADNLLIDGFRQVVKQDDHVISRFDDNADEHEANANHIVKCVNLHEELVERLEYLLNVLQPRISQYGLNPIQELLKRARGE